MWKNNSGVSYDGPTHELAGVTYSGATRTPDSRRLVWVEAPPKKPNATPSKPKPPAKKKEPRAKGASAWD